LGINGLIRQNGCDMGCGMNEKRIDWSKKAQANLFGVAAE
jgi:hypothetical protein